MTRVAEFAGKFNKPFTWMLWPKQRHEYTHYRTNKWRSNPVWKERVESTDTFPRNLQLRSAFDDDRWPNKWSSRKCFWERSLENFSLHHIKSHLHWAWKKRRIYNPVESSHVWIHPEPPVSSVEPYINSHTDRPAKWWAVWCCRLWLNLPTAPSRVIQFLLFSLLGCEMPNMLKERSARNGVKIQEMGGKYTQSGVRW